MDYRSVSGNIWSKEGGLQKEDFYYVIINPTTGQECILPSEDLNPEDLRMLADEIERSK